MLCVVAYLYNVRVVRGKAAHFNNKAIQSASQRTLQALSHSAKTRHYTIIKFEGSY